MIKKTCFDCKNSEIDPGYSGSFDPRYGGDPPVAAEANCQHPQSDQTDDMIYGESSVDECPFFDEKIFECVVCGEKALITERQESPYGGCCCSDKCYDIQTKKEGFYNEID